MYRARARGPRRPAVIRRYRFDPNNSEEINRRVRDAFVHLLRKTPGFEAYYWLDTGEGEGASLILEEGICRSAEEVAESEKVTRSFVNRLLRLTLLAPDIQEAILEGRQPKAMQLEELTDAIPSEWEKQRKAHLSGAA